MATHKKPPTKKRTGYLAIALAGVLILAAVSGYVLYRLVSSRLARQIPPFETYLSQGTEANVKQIDRCIYDALLGFNVPADHVVFKSVETKRDNKETWTFSELEIRLLKPVSRGSIEAAFYKRLSGLVPTPSLRFASGPQDETIVELSVNGRNTHRLVFLTAGEKKPVICPPRRRPRVAIIVDDLGHDPKIASRFLELDAVLSFSVLPHSPFQKSIATAIHRRGRDVLLHLPMEPLEYPQVDPGGGTLFCSMDADELIHQLRKNLDAVPFVVGVNNHMGSRLTQDSAKMRQIFTMLKRRNLFFVDSFTNPTSCCAHAARLLQLNFARRHVFLDHVEDAHSIRFQIKRLLTIAKTQGQAIGIAHPYPITWKVLKDELPNIHREVDIVRVSKLVGGQPPGPLSY